MSLSGTQLTRWCVAAAAVSLLATVAVRGDIHISFASAASPASASTRPLPGRVDAVPDGSTGSTTNGSTPASVSPIAAYGRFGSSLTLADGLDGLHLYLQCNSKASQLQIASDVQSDLSMSVVSYSGTPNGASAFTEYGYFPQGAGSLVLPEYGIVGSDLVTFSFHPRPPAGSPVELTGIFTVANAGSDCDVFGTAEEAAAAGTGVAGLKHPAR